MVEPKKPTKRAAKGVPKDEVSHAVSSLDASNQGVTAALQYVGKGLDAIQDNRRSDRRQSFLIAAVVLALLLGLALNAYEGRQARNKLVDQSQQQNEILEIVKDATSPQRQAEGQKRLAQIVAGISCDNQRNIQRAMVNLGAPYELTPECR